MSHGALKTIWPHHTVERAQNPNLPRQRASYSFPCWRTGWHGNSPGAQGSANQPRHPWWLFLLKRSSVLLIVSDAIITHPCLAALQVSVVLIPASVLRLSSPSVRKQKPARISSLHFPTMNRPQICSQHHFENITDKDHLSLSLPAPFCFLLWSSMTLYLALLLILTLIAPLGYTLAAVFNTPRVVFLLPQKLFDTKDYLWRH